LIDLQTTEPLLETLPTELLATSVCAPICGDGIVTGSEQCDPGASDDSSAQLGCTSTCEFRCGNGTVEEEFEECDNGFNVSVYALEDGACSPTCQHALRCGDGVVSSQFGELCDDGVNDGGYGECGEGCVLGPRCGDGIVQAEFEECDAGPGNGDGPCEVNCRLFQVEQ
jgi:hypothetical protein